jgi:hypothetical protein
LYYRADKVSSDEASRRKEEKHVFESLQNNDYPKDFLLKVRRKMKQKEAGVDNNEAVETEMARGMAVLPFVQGTTEKIKRVLERHNINVAIRPVSTLRNYLMKPKDKLPHLDQTGVVYSIPCQDCDVKYIGETGRALGTRIKEHHASVKNGKVQNSALAEHVFDNGHRIVWDDTKVVCKESRWSRNVRQQRPNWMSGYIIFIVFL